MKTQLHLLIATVLGTTLAMAQDDRRPEPPPQVRLPDAPRLPSAPRPPTRAAVPTRPAAFLGVATSPVPPVLAAQLGLPAGFGLVVDEVMPDSPAGKSGVLRLDVLRLFNDQQLLDPDQLAALVRAQGKDSDVTLTVLRKGEEQKLSIKISERPMPVRVPGPRLTGEMREQLGQMNEQLDRLKDGIGDRTRRLQEQARDYERRIREYHELLKKWQAEAGAALPKLPEFPGPLEPADIPPSGPVTSSTASAKVLMKDDSGEIEVTSTDGRRHLLAKNAKGETIFDGPIDTPEQLKALPEELRKKVESVEVRTQVNPTAPPRR